MYFWLLYVIKRTLPWDAGWPVFLWVAQETAAILATLSEHLPSIICLLVARQAAPPRPLRSYSMNLVGPLIPLSCLRFLLALFPQALDWVTCSLGGCFLLLLSPHNCPRTTPFLNSLLNTDQTSFSSAFNKIFCIVESPPLHAINEHNRGTKSGPSPGPSWGHS